MKTPTIEHDERTIAVENSSYRWGYLVLAFGLLATVAYRALAWGQSNWDLLALIGLSALATTMYQWAHRVVTRRWLAVGVTTAIVAALIAAAIILLH